MLKESLSKIALDGLMLPKIKGHTKIELTNIKTGKKEVIEHDNTFTTGLASYLRDLGFARNNPLMNSSVYNAELWKDLLGGIYLFDTPLVGNEKYMPAGVLMTGNSYYNASNNANPTELGSYNAVESSANINEVTFVYDWGTSQGNGTIAAVSLGTVTGGYIGYGNATSKTSKTNKTIYEHQPDNIISGTSVNNILYYDNFVYRCASDQHNSGITSINIKKNHYPITKVDAFYNINLGNIADYPETITFTLPEALSETYMIMAAGIAYPSCFMLIPRNSQAANATITFYLLDVSDGTVTKKTFTNNTGAQIYGNAGIFMLLLDDTYAIVRTTNAGGAIYKINYTNSAVIGEATKNGFPDSNVMVEYAATAFTDKLYAFGRCESYLYDPVKNAFYPTNGRIGTYNSNELFSYYYLADEDCLASNRSYNGKRITACKNPLRLMTINNLDTPVEKTADKTMKITYTISRATE